MFRPDLARLKPALIRTSIRSIQQLLGHAKLDTTQIYTQVSIRQLKQVHTLTHPANMGPEGEMLDRPDDSLYDGDDE